MSVPQSEAAVASFTGVVPAEAIGGLDAVELEEGHRVAGKGRYTFVYQGLQWRFATEANKQRFVNHPEAYIPD